MAERQLDLGFFPDVDPVKPAAVWSTPELRDLGHLRSFVQLGGPKTGPCCEGQGTGSGEECKRPIGQGGCGNLPFCGQPPCVLPP